MSIAARIIKSRVARAVSAHAYNQVVQLGLQLAAVPILTAHWGLTTYGTWLLLFTIPSYLAMADLGFSSAAGNEMTMRVARGDDEGAADVFLALRMIVAGATLVLFAAAALVICVLFPHVADFADGATGGRSQATLLLLVAYGFLSLLSGVPVAGFKATHAYVLCGYIWVTMLLLEAVCALVWVARGGGLFGAALAYLTVRTLGSILLAVILRFHAPQLYTQRWRAAVSHIRILIKPAIGVMALPVAQAIALQGAVVAIGAAAGPAAVPLFTTVRTLTRTALQVTFIVNMASMPAFTVAAAQHDEQKKSRLVLLCLLASVVFLIPAAPILVFGGQFIVGLWSHGHIHPPMILLLFMTVAMLFNGAWMPLSNYILAINLHSGFSYYYAIVSAICMAIGYGLARQFGPEGVAFALALIDIVMLHRIIRLALRVGVLDPPALRAELQKWMVYLPRPRSAV